MRSQPPRDYTIVDVARAFSVAAHSAVNQKRKYTGEDYYHHPEDVLQILLTYDEPTIEMQLAALLHDTVEDTEVRFEHISRLFGQDVAKLVFELTDVSKPTDGNRPTRKSLDLLHLEKASREGKRVKCADLISNSKSIVALCPEFAKVYLIEKLRILVMMHPSIGDTKIWNKAMSVCSKGMTIIWPDIQELTKVLKAEGFSDVDQLTKRG